MPAIAPITVVPYRPEWQAEFRGYRDRVAAALGDVAVSIDHVGSTSVPGLAAKPIIDLDVAVADASVIPLAIERLAAIGYVHEGDLGIPGREAFINPPGTPRHHLYVCTVDNPEYQRHLLFRDYLRAHPDEAAQYGELKQELARRFPYERETYWRGKTELVLAILERARAWRRP
ncbi:MAG TPA: GrpB family protein [Symbiobacteriaceae bacterium]|nr:GrpB family protein [Symbiobacteriaceae bacterium]